MTVWSRDDQKGFLRGRRGFDEESGIFHILLVSQQIDVPRVDPLERRLPGGIKEGDKPLIFLTKPHDHRSIQFLHADRFGAKGGPEIVIKGNIGFS